VEYLVVCLDEEQNKVRLSLRQSDILENLKNSKDVLQYGGKHVKYDNPFILNCQVTNPK
jgi:hypothetical protein